MSPPWAQGGTKRSGSPASLAGNEDIGMKGAFVAHTMRKPVVFREISV
jgi:hypothetical protein